MVGRLTVLVCGDAHKFSVGAAIDSFYLTTKSDVFVHPSYALSSAVVADLFGLSF